MNADKSKVSYWLGQMDMIANMFMMWRDCEDDRRILKAIANLYNTQFDGKNEPNIHVEYFLKKSGDPKH